jgi:hypothetical protein
VAQILTIGVLGAITFSALQKDVFRPAAETDTLAAMRLSPKPRPAYAHKLVLQRLFGSPLIRRPFKTTAHIGYCHVTR